jgi:hypothetical protein
MERFVSRRAGGVSAIPADKDMRMVRTQRGPRMIRNFGAHIIRAFQLRKGLTLNLAL